jgi:hypothetical protein
MAVIGLRVNQGPSLNLSDIFKNAMNDPDTVMKMELAKSKIWNDYYQNQVYQQQAEEQRQLGIKTGQEATDLKTLAGVRAGAVPGITQGLVGAIPKPADQPAPVEISRIAGPVNGVPVSAPPAIVDQNYNNDQVAAAKARGSLYPYIAKDASDLSTGYGKDLGNEALASGLTPGGPAAVNLTPDRMRLAATLTGQMPTTSTMITSGDTAPAVNAVREAAGKLPYDVALEQAKAEAKAQADLAANPLGTSGVGPAAVHLAALKAKAPGSLTPEEQQLIPMLETIVAKETSVSQPEKSTMQTYDPVTKTWKSSGGGAPAAPSSVYNKGTGGDAIERGHLDDISAQIVANPAFVPTQLQLNDYETAYTNQILTPRSVDTGAKDEVGNPVFRMAMPVKPAGMLTPAQVRARMLGQPITAADPAPAPATPADGGLAPSVGGITPTGVAVAAPGAVPAEAVPADTGAVTTGANGLPVVTQQVGKRQEYVGTADQNRDKTLVPVLTAAYAHIRDTPPGDIPNAFWQVWGNPTNDPSTIETWIEQNAPPSSRRYLQALNQFTLNLYLLSGAAFPGGEKPQNIRTFAMSQADNADPQTRANKLQAMVFLLNGIQNNAFAGDPEGRHKAQVDGLKRFGVQFDDSLYPPDPVDPAASQVTAPTGGPNKLILPPGVPVPPNWGHYTPAAAARYLQNHPPTQAQ